MRAEKLRIDHFEADVIFHTTLKNLGTSSDSCTTRGSQERRKGGLFWFGTLGLRKIPDPPPTCASTPSCPSILLGAYAIWKMKAKWRKRHVQQPSPPPSALAQRGCLRKGGEGCDSTVLWCPEHTTPPLHFEPSFGKQSAEDLAGFPAPPPPPSSLSDLLGSGRVRPETPGLRAWAGGTI